MAQTKKEYLDMDQVVDMCKVISETVKREGYKPELIIGLGRGGWIPARFISDLLEVKNIASMGVTSYQGMSKQGLSISEQLGVDVRGKRLLVVDDISDTGQTLEFVVEYLRKLGAKSIKTATLHYKPIKDQILDYYAATTDSWVVYPWELVEDEKEWS